jgi:hypothetical protein
MWLSNGSYLNFLNVLSQFLEKEGRGSQIGHTKPAKHVTLKIFHNNEPQKVLPHDNPKQVWNNNRAKLTKWQFRQTYASSSLLPPRQLSPNPFLVPKQTCLRFLCGNAKMLPRNSPTVSGA